MVDRAKQNLRRKAGVSPACDGLEVDLGDACPERLHNFSRCITCNGRIVRLRDGTGEALWGMVTEAEVELNGRAAAVREIASAAGARFGVESTQPPAPQNQNRGTRKLVVRLPGKVQSADIEVSFRLVS